MSVVIKPVSETEIFINEAGTVAIVQTDPYGEKQGVDFPIEYIDAVIDGLLKLKEE